MNRLCCHVRKVAITFSKCNFSHFELVTIHYQTLQTWIGLNVMSYHNLNAFPHALPHYGLLILNRDKMYCNACGNTLNLWYCVAFWPIHVFMVICGNTFKHNWNDNCWREKYMNMDIVYKYTYYSIFIMIPLLLMLMTAGNIQSMCWSMNNN